ncbi:MAG: SH3 domain-containing protein [Acidobacteria bacterium]|nr:SH3 domain-containing protein [Acidobacteriota bacterium]
MKTANFAWLFILGTLLALLPAGNTSAYREGTTDRLTIVPCDVRAYVIDRDPGGLKVRSGPGKTYKAIGSLPNREVEGIGVHITGASGEWVRIDRALEEGGEQERTFFQGEGWVYAPLLGVGGMAITDGGTNLYQDTTKKSRVIIRIPGGDDSVKVQGCQGQWMYVEYKKKRGWAAPDTLCANSLTTCV